MLRRLGFCSNAGTGWRWTMGGFGSRLIIRDLRKRFQSVQRVAG